MNSFITPLGLACLATAGMAAGQPTTMTMMTRVTRDTTSSDTSTSQQTSNHKAKLIAAIVIPILSTLLIIVIALLLRRKLRRRDVSRSEAISSRQRMRRCFEAVRASFVPGYVSATYGVDAGGTGGDSAPATTHSRRTRASRQNRLRRTESGSTVKTLPEYKSSPAENELMLYKADASPSDLDLNGLDTPDMVQYEARSLINRRSTASGHSHVDTQTDGAGEQAVEAHDRHANASIADMAANGLSSLRRSLRRSVVGRSSSAAHPPPAMDTEATVDTELENLDDTHAARSATSLTHGDATPTYDSLYPAISLDAVSSEGVSTPSLTLPAQATRTPNIFLNIFRRPPALVRNAHSSSAAPPGRQRLVSNASVLSTAMEGGNASGDVFHASVSNDLTSLELVGTPSNDASLYRPSTGQSARRNINPFPRFHLGNSSVSLLSGRPSLEQSSMTGHDGEGATGTAVMSHHRRNISAPLSIRRLQYEPPVAGFSDQQMAFLASVESLDRYGIPLGGSDDDPASGSRGTLPSFEQLARQQERQERQRQSQLLQHNVQLGGASDQVVARPAVVLTPGEVFQRRQQQEDELAHRTQQQQNSEDPEPKALQQQRDDVHVSITFESATGIQESTTVGGSNDNAQT